ncbi:MAG: hypothetical protein R1F54_08880 [Candidatus Zeuxoniibacter abyssi]|nr:MAG: hypothetical protein R1F54_08880 [Candidatus Persebacteraceae bacterium AB1(2)]
MSVSLRKIAKDRKFRYFLITFVDLFGVARAKLVPAVAIDAMQNEGAGFAGFAAYLDMTPAHPDMLAIPDPASLIQLPWKPEVGWLAADPWMNGKAVAQAPRNVLRTVLARAKNSDFRQKAAWSVSILLSVRMALLSPTRLISKASPVMTSRR